MTVEYPTLIRELKSNNCQWNVTFFPLLLVSDEVDLPAGFPARPAGSLGTPKSHPPGCSSYSVFLHPSCITALLWVGPGWPSGWLSGSISLLIGLLGRPTPSPHVPDWFDGLWWSIPAQWKNKGFSNRYYTLILAKRPRWKVTEARKPKCGVAISLCCSKNTLSSIYVQFLCATNNELYIN